MSPVISGPSAVFKSNGAPTPPYEAFAKDIERELIRLTGDHGVIPVVANSLAGMVTFWREEGRELPAEIEAGFLKEAATFYGAIPNLDLDEIDDAEKRTIIDRIWEMGDVWALPAPGEPQEPEEAILRAVIDRLAALDPLKLKLCEQAEADALSKRLKRKITAQWLRSEVKKARQLCGAGKQDKPPTQVETLLELCEHAKLFHSAEQVCFATIPVFTDNGAKLHFETWPIRSRGFRRWLASCYFLKTDGAPNSEAMGSALNALEARAAFEGNERPVYVRVAGHDGKIYIDLVDERWRAIEIDAKGWCIVAKPPVCFVRPPGMKALPVPMEGGKIDALKPFLNLKTDHDFVMAVAWLLGAFHPNGPYPVLGLSGEEGTAKTTMARLLRALIDPNTIPLRTLPKEERDLWIAVTKAHVYALDNLSGLPQWLSDALARLATKGGFGTRGLHTDDEEALFTAVKPVILTGINEAATRPDLASRSIFLALQTIAAKERKLESRIEAEFAAAAPGILGALLDAVSTGLKMLPLTKLDDLPRMADFAIWVTACESAFWKPGTFMKAYKANIKDAANTVIEGDIVAATLREYMEKRLHPSPGSGLVPVSEWKGTATELLAVLNNQVTDVHIKRSNQWPALPHVLSRRLHGCAAVMRKQGIDITQSRSSSGRTIKVTIDDAF